MSANKKNIKEKKKVIVEPGTAQKKSMAGWIASLSQEEKICLGLLAVLVIAIIIIRAKFSLIPFERDEGIYTYIGKLLLQGKVPYKDFYEQKFPGLFYFYGLMVGLFGNTVEGIHSGFMYLNIVSIILIYFTGRNLFSPIAGLISATTFGFTSLDPYLSGFTVQAEHGVAFFIVLGLFFYSLFQKNPKWYFNILMGFAFGCAFMVKTSGIFFVMWGGLMLIFNFFTIGKKSIRDLIRNVFVYAAGVFGIIGILFLTILIKGSFAAMFFWAFEVPKNYVGKITLDMGIQYFKYNGTAIVRDYQFFWISSLLSLLLCFAKVIHIQMKFLIISLLFFSFCTIVPGYYFYGHYWIQLLPGLAIAGGLTYQAIILILQNNFSLTSKALKYVYLLIFCLFTCYHVSAFSGYYLTPDYETILRAVYGNNPFPEAMEIGDFINANAKPDDGLVLMGAEPEIYFYTNKNSPSRHAYFSALVSNVPQHRQWQREFVQDVEKAKPKYLVYFNHPISLFVQPNSDHYIFDWMKQYVDSNYKLIGIVDMIDGQRSVYKWKEQVNNYRVVGQNAIYVFELK